MNNKKPDNEFSCVISNQYEGEGEDICAICGDKGNIYDTCVVCGVPICEKCYEIWHCGCDNALCEKCCRQCVACDEPFCPDCARHNKCGWGLCENIVCECCKENYGGVCPSCEDAAMADARASEDGGLRGYDFIRL